MPTLDKIEAQAYALYLKAKYDYDAVSMKIAANPKTAVIVTALVFFVLGHVL